MIVNLVGDGWSGRPGPLTHQIVLLPVTAAFLFCTWRLLIDQKPPVVDPKSSSAGWATVTWLLWLIVAMEVCAALLFLYAGEHFARLGYHPGLISAGCVFLPLLAVLVVLALSSKRTPQLLLITAMACSAGWLILAITHFPLNYLRSDMLPVILWADTNLLHHISPYTTMHVGVRTYDFPYLPGMLVAFLPFIAAHLDIRWGSLVYLLASAAILFWAARREHKLEVATILGLFLVQPFLQYRHDLYLEPHWLTLIAAYLLMQRRHFAWAALVFGISMAIYQFSWILFPFVLLNAFRRKGLIEAAKLLVAGALGALLVVGPFIASAIQRISHNAVGQWGALKHPGADPMNLSYWATYVISIGSLLRLQAVLMVAIFAWAFFRGRCTTLADTLQWSIGALTVFILFNSIVDGYFFLMLLVPMLLYTCVANGWLEEPSPQVS